MPKVKVRRLSSGVACATRVAQACVAAGAWTAVGAVAAQAGSAQARPAATDTAATAAAATALRLHVPSPDWRDQVIYFALTDRFDDGDPRNNDQGAGEYRPGSAAHYQGGDLAGLARRIDYIRGLGATALWITPPVANRWWDEGARFSGYHGYWASHFAQVDPHLGTLDDYRQLSHALHSAGLYLVQDIVVNHTGNFFGYGADWSAADPARGWRAEPGQPAKPAQAPFDRNDPRDPAQRRDQIYHWTPDVRDFGQRKQVLTHQMSGLDDLNTAHPAVRRALRASYGHWIREVGVDAFRVDTALYVPEGYFDDFLHARDPQAPGVLRVAEATGRRQFHVFGEGFAIDPPFSNREAAKIERYATAPGGRPRLPGMINFPLYGSLNQVLAQGAAPAVLGHRIAAMVRTHRDPHRMHSFVDNHDVDRFLAGGSPAALRQALLAIFTLPGIPVIYYGTEQGFTEQRASMFAAGHGSGGRDRFDTDAPFYRLIRQLSDLRRTHRLFSRGLPQVLQAQVVGPGVLAWRMQWGRQSALVVMNTADHPSLLANLATGARAGSLLPALLALDGNSELAQVGRVEDAAQVGPDGRLSRALPARSAVVWALPETTPAAPATDSTARPSRPVPTALPARLAQLHLDALRPEAGSDWTLASGRAPAGSTVQVVLDGRIDQAAAALAGPDGRWQARLDTRATLDNGPPSTVVAWLPDAQQATPPRVLRIPRAWRLVADLADPVGDDRGRDGRTTYPTDPSWGVHRQMDIQRVQVWRAGGALRVRLTMHDLSRTWNPPNGFDHAAFTLFFSLPGRTDGATAMPGQDGNLPEGLRWHWRLRAGGWATAWYAADGATAQDEGRAATPGPQVLVDRAQRSVQFTWPASAFGAEGLPAGSRLYLNTWDHDGGYRARTDQPGSHTPGGGPGVRLMDEAGPILLP